MAKSGVPTAKAKGRSQNKATAAPPQACAPAAQFADKSSRKRYEVPADFQESEAALRLHTDPIDTNTELWLFQLPHELDPTESLSWQLSTTTDGAVSGTCQDSEGVSYILTEEPSDMATQLYTTPAAGSNKLTQFKRRVTVVKSEAAQLQDNIEAAATPAAAAALHPTAATLKQPKEEKDSKDKKKKKKHKDRR
ncbi:hypothetical protein WJX82_011543 [Trebouxia sp. C0006]